MSDKAERVGVIREYCIWACTAALIAVGILGTILCCVGVVGAYRAIDNPLANPLSPLLPLLGAVASAIICVTINQLRERLKMSRGCDSLLVEERATDVIGNGSSVDGRSFGSVGLWESVYELFGFLSALVSIGLTIYSIWHWLFPGPLGR